MRESGCGDIKKIAVVSQRFQAFLQNGAGSLAGAGFKISYRIAVYARQ